MFAPLLITVILGSSAIVSSPSDVSPRPEDTADPAVALGTGVTAAIGIPSGFEAESHDETVPELTRAAAPAAGEKVERHYIRGAKGDRWYVYETSAASSTELAYGPAGAR